MKRDRLSPLSKCAIAVRAVRWFVVVRLRLHSRSLPEVVTDLGTVNRAYRSPRRRPARLGRIVSRVLRIGPWRARCLHTSIVLYRLLREQGDDAQLVIGLPLEPKDKDAHAWVEMDGHDVGPPPGRGEHVELARYG
jgi:transglutaminase-like putative cysteine protease